MYKLILNKNSVMKKLTVCFLNVSLAFFISGCASVISKDLKSQIEEKLSIKDVMKNHEKAVGNIVIWGGEIIESKNLKEGTLIEILQKPLNPADRPREVDMSEGRFFALYGDYLDVAIYAPGRLVTVAGSIKEIKKQSIGEIEYSYPVISADQVYLWPKVKRDRYYHPYPSYFYWDYPYWHHRPYW